MARTLNAYVYVNGVGYAPGDAVPDDVAKKIGAHAWTSEEEPDAQAPASGSGGVGDPVPAADEVKAPPRSGRGSGTEAWRAYADAIGVDYADGAERDEIIIAVDAHQRGQ